MQIVELVILALLAAVVIYQLYAVLGRRVGRQPEDEPQPALAKARLALAPDTPPVEDGEPVELKGLPALAAKDPDFDLGKFLAGARGAFETIVQAFAAGDRGKLKELVSGPVMQGFEPAIAEREAQGVKETVEFPHEPRADLEEAEVEGDLARLKVRFLGEMRRHILGPKGEDVDERRTAEVWTFERNLKSQDPNWTLVRVEAAQA